MSLGANIVRPRPGSGTGADGQGQVWWSHNALGTLWEVWSPQLSSALGAATGWLVQAAAGLRAPAAANQKATGHRLPLRSRSLLRVGGSAVKVHRAIARPCPHAWGPRQTPAATPLLQGSTHPELRSDETYMLRTGSGGTKVGTKASFAESMSTHTPQITCS